ncbi:uncharacterized protein LOC123004065 [Tribolium madens]|uniref:uncharacterized protein LOC123004065 n=1 Tax=Tribolium madens TaxID=41895 RepID=UPI001CF75223|nr:uncharacterized protein LOC123004065 [Tribolium madens]
MQLLSVCIFLTLFNGEIGDSEFDKTAKCVSRIVAKFAESETVIYVIDTNLRLTYPVIYQSSSVQYFTLFKFRLPDIYVIKLGVLNIDQMLFFLDQFDHFNSRAKYIILSGIFKPAEIFQKLLNYFVHNVIILTPEGTAITYKPYVYENVLPEEVKPVVLGPCLRLNPTALFSTSLPKFWRNTTIPAVYFNMYPFLYSDHDDHLQGIAFRNFQLIQELLQFQINVTRHKIGAFGTSRINKTYTNVLG